jgi:glycosyltransferase involved in cell wall biosynthesis
MSIATDVTIAISVRDGEAYLAEALASCHAQTLRAAEILVIDDGSTDASAQVAEELGARVVSQPPRGLAAGRNEGVRRAGCELVAFLDADDRMPPERLARQVGYLEQHPEDDGVLGAMRLFATRVESGVGVDYFEAPAPGYCGGALLVRRSSYLATGGMDESVSAGEFIEWMTRFLDEGGRIAMIEDVVLERRVHANNMTRAVAKTHAEYLSVVRKSILRRRAAATPPPASSSE